MARLLFDNRVKLVTSTKPNASAVFAGMDGSAPSGGYINPEAIHDPTTGVVIATNDIVPYCAFADDLFECGFGTIDTSAHTLTRASATVSNSSGTKVRIDFSGASVEPTIICSYDAMMGRSSYNLLRNQIYGENLTYTSATAFGAAAGCSWIEGLEGAPYAGSYSNLTGQTGTAAHFYNVFKFLSSGVPTLEKVDGGTAGSTNPPVAFANPAGSARSKTSDTSRRFLGTLLYGATNTIRPFRMNDLGGGIAEMIYLADTSDAAPFLQLSLAGGTSPTSLTALDMSTLIPNNGTAVEALISVDVISNTTTAPSAGMRISTDGTGHMALLINPSATTADLISPLWVPLNSDTTTALYYELTDADAGAAMFCWAYRFRR